MISFYPGPSQLYSQIPAFAAQAFSEGILSLNHRSSEFSELYKQTEHLLKVKLQIPEDYRLFFTSSATECWEIIAQSLIERSSFHIYNGAFGEKWYHYSRKLKPAAGLHFAPEKPLPNDEIVSEADVYCITQNETSNGTQISKEYLKHIKNKATKKLIAIDATSSLGGILLDFKLGDIWFASVQKCLGLPAGLGLLICSPTALEKADRISESDHYNSLGFLNQNREKFQTSYTPNVLGIFLLKKVLEMIPDINKTHEHIKNRANKLYHFFAGSEQVKPLTSDTNLRSDTVLCLKGNPDLIEHIKTECRDQGLLLGNGYGNLVKDTLRIANFPALSDSCFEQLTTTLKHFL